MTRWSKLIRKLTKQKYLKKYGREPKPGFSITEDGIIVLYQLYMYAQAAGLTFDDIASIALNPKITAETFKDTFKNTLVASSRFTEAALQMYKSKEVVDDS